MTATKAPTRDILVCYVLATVFYGIALCFGRLDDDSGPHIMSSLLLLNLLVVAAATFKWGSISGFPVMSEEHGFSSEFLARNVVMTGLVILMLSILGSPVWLGVFWLLSPK